MCLSSQLFQFKYGNGNPISGHLAFAHWLLLFQGTGRPLTLPYCWKLQIGTYFTQSANSSFNCVKYFLFQIFMLFTSEFISVTCILLFTLPSLYFLRVLFRLHACMNLNAVSMVWTEAMFNVYFKTGLTYGSLGRPRSRDFRSIST